MSNTTKAHVGTILHGYIGSVPIRDRIVLSVGICTSEVILRMAHQAGSLPTVQICLVTMLVDYTTLLDRPGVSVEGLTQQGVESIVEVTTTSGITSDRSDDPSL
jgi:hypothetical protein